MLKPSGGFLKKVFDPLGVGKKIGKVGSAMGSAIKGTGKAVGKVGGAMTGGITRTAKSIPANPIKGVQKLGKNMAKDTKKVGGVLGKAAGKVF
jgi:hypothetical protein